MRTFAGLYLILLAIFCLLGCDEGFEIADDLDSILAEQAITDGVPQWHRAPHKDIILQVPDNLDRYLPPAHVSLRPDETFEEMQARFEELKAIRDEHSDNLDWSTALSTHFVVYGDRVYVSDGAGKNIHVFGLDGNPIPEEKMSRPDSSIYTPAKPTDPNSVGFRSSYDGGGKMLISEDGEVILQIISTRSDGVNLNRWYPNARPYVWSEMENFVYIHNKGIGAVEKKPIFCADGYMYYFKHRTSIDARSGRDKNADVDFSHSLLHKYSIAGRSWVVELLELEGVPEIVREHGWGGGSKVGEGFATESHIYIKSGVDFDNPKDPRFQWDYHTFYVWTKDGKYVGKSDVYRDMDMTRFQRKEFAHSQCYHRQSKTLYILGTGGQNVGQEVGQNIYSLIAFQQQ